MTVTDFLFLNAGVLMPELQRNFHGEETGQFISCRMRSTFTSLEMYPSVLQPTALQEVSD